LLETAALRVSDAVLLDSGTRGLTISREPLCPVTFTLVAKPIGRRGGGLENRCDLELFVILV